MVDLIREWWHDSSGLKIISDKVYSIQSLKKLQMLVAIMLCRLYGENDSLKFKLGWVPLIHQTLEGKIFNWAHILSQTFNKKLRNDRKHQRVIVQGFSCSVI
jgi:hypothetical protein